MSTFSHVGRSHDRAWVRQQRRWIRARRREEWKRVAGVLLRPALLILAALLSLGAMVIAQ